MKTVKIIASLIIAVLLLSACTAGVLSPSEAGNAVVTLTPAPAESPVPTEIPAMASAETPANTPAPEPTFEQSPAPSDSSVPEPSPEPEPASEPEPAGAPKTTKPINKPTEKPSAKPSSTPDDTCTVSIDCKKAYSAGFDIAAKVSHEGIILNKASVTVKEGDTIFTVLKRVCKENGIPISSRSSNLGRYIYSINSLAEMDCGPQSGWMYSVNGEFIQKSASEYKIKPGDKIKWRYTLKNGDDLS